MVSEKSIIQDLETLSELKDISLIKTELSGKQNVFNNEIIKKY